MKVLSTFICLSIFFCMFSCSNEELLNKALRENESDSINTRSLENCFEIDYGPFANQVQWISYLCSQVLLRNEDGKQQFLDVLSKSKSGKIVPLEDVLSSNLLLLDFREEFQEEFLFYHLYGCNQGGHPQGTPRPPGSPNQNPGTIDEQLFDIYVSTLLNPTFQHKRKWIAVINDTSTPQQSIPQTHSLSPQSSIYQDTTTECKLTIRKTALTFEKKTPPYPNKPRPRTV